jgi:hypothetical protein
MCDLKIYQPGDKVDMRNGGILYKGGLNKTNKENGNTEVPQ